MLKAYLEEIKTAIEAVNADFYCEIEYDGKYCPESIDIRIVNDGFVPTSEMVLNRLLNTGAVKRNWYNPSGEYTVDIPSEDEVKFAFGGVKFERIEVGIEKELQDPNLEVLLQVYNEY